MSETILYNEYTRYFKNMPRHEFPFPARIPLDNGELLYIGLCKDDPDKKGVRPVRIAMYDEINPDSVFILNRSQAVRIAAALIKYSRHATNTYTKKGSASQKVPE